MANNGRVHTINFLPHDKRGKSYGQDNSHQMAAESSGNRKQGKDKKPQAHHEPNVKACHTTTDQKKLFLLPMIPLQLVAGALGLATVGAGASIIGSLPGRRGEFQFPRIPLYQPRIEPVQWISGTGNGSKDKPEEKDKEKEKEKKAEDETEDESKKQPSKGAKGPKRPKMPKKPRENEDGRSSSSESEDESSSSSSSIKLVP